MRVITLAAAVALAGCSPQAAKLAGALADKAPAAERAAAPEMPVTAAVALSGPMHESGPMPDDQAPPVTPAAPGQCKSRPIAEYATRMVGADKADIANWPGFAAISIVSPDGKDSQFFCGGILADASTVITAAHCLKEARQQADGKWIVRRPDGKAWRLGVLANQGDVRADGIETRVLVASGATYLDGARKYDDVTQANDIAFLKLEKPLTGAQTMRLAGTPVANPRLSRHFLFAAGFGQMNETGKGESVPNRSGGITSALSSQLREAILPLASPAECLKAGATDDRGQICAGWPGGKRDTCAGDSGGPLVAIDDAGCPYVVGLTSFGPQACGAVAQPAVYTRVSQYRAWIAAHAPDAKFADNPPPVMGSEAVSVLMHNLIDQFSQTSSGVKIEILDKSMKPFPIENGRVVVPVGQQTIYRVSVNGDLSGQLLLVDRQQARKAADGQLSRVYFPIFPNKNSTARSISPASPLVVGDIGFDVKATITDPAASKEQGEMIALVLPPDIDFAKLMAPPDRTRGFDLSPPDDIPQAVTELEAVTALLHPRSTRAAGSAGAGKYGAGTAPYEIRK